METIDSADSTLEPDIDVYDLKGDQRHIATLTGREDWNWVDFQVRYSGRHGAVIVLHQGQTQAFSIETGESLTLPIEALQQPEICALAVSRDGELQAIWSQRAKRVEAWRTGTAKPIWTADNIEAGRKVAFEFSADGHWLGLATGQDRTKSSSGTQQRGPSNFV